MDQQTQGTVAGITKVMGTLASGRSELAAGRAQQTAAYSEAAQMRQNAGQVQASAQRGAEEKRRQAQLMVSRAIAVAGASGAGVSDTAVANLIARLEGEGELAAMTSLYEGDTEAAQMRRQAGAREYEGSSMYAASKTKAFGTLMEGAKGLSDLFPGEGTPKEKAKASTTPSPYSLSSGKSSFGFKVK